MDRPAKWMLPLWAARKPVTRLKIVVLPEPFGPIRPTTSPGPHLEGDVLDADRAAEAHGDIREGRAALPRPPQLAGRGRRHPSANCMIGAFDGGRPGGGGAMQSIGDQRDEPAAALTDMTLDTPWHKPHDQHQERAVDDEMSALDGAAPQGRAGELADGNQDDRPEQRPEDAAEPSEHRHDDHLHRQIEAYGARRRDEQHHLGVEGARERP